MVRSRPASWIAAAITVVVLCAVPAGAGAAEPGAEGLLAVGSTAPDFEAVDIDGGPFVLSEALRRGPVLLVFWSIFCGTCREELPIIEQERPKLPAQLQVVTLNLDEAPRARTVKGFAQQQGFSFRMLLNKVDGREFNVEQAYGVKATPAIYLLQTDGTVAFAHYGALSPERLLEVAGEAR